MSSCAFRGAGAVLVLLATMIGWYSTEHSMLLALKSSAQEVIDASELKIVILDGSEGINIVKKKTAVKPIVEVRDKNNLPIAGAAVLFMVPHSGPSAVFENGKRELILTTDMRGRATVIAMRPVGNGAFRIAVRATFQGHVATASISQTNYLTIAAAQAASAASHAAASVASSGTAGSTSASTTSTATSAASATGGGLSGTAIAGIVGGVAAAGVVGGAYAAGAIGHSSSQDCSSNLSQLQSDLNTAIQVCGTAVGYFDTCQPAVQTALNDAGTYCSCAGGGGSVPSNYVQELQSLASQLSLTLPSSCGW